MSTPNRFASEVKTALSNVAWKVLSMPFEKVCRFVLVAAAARMVGTAPFGRFRYATTLTLMLSFLMDLGLGLWTIRELARDRTRAATVTRTVLRVRILLGIPYLLATAVFAALAAGETWTVILLLGLAGLVSVLIDHAVAVFRGYERFRDEARLNAARGVLVLGAALLGMWLRPSVLGLTAGTLGGTVAAGLYGVWIMRGQY